MAARNLQSRSFTRKKRARFWWTLALVVVVVISWLCALSSLTRLNAFAITDVKIFGGNADITGALQSAAEQVLTGNYLALFPRDSTLIYPKSGIITAVKEASSRVKDVVVSRDGLHGLIVSISLKAPAAVVCATLPDFQDNKLIFDDYRSCYFVDDSGLIFEQVSTLPSHIYNLYYAPDMSGSVPSTDPIGSYATSTTEFLALQSFYNGAKALGMSPSAILIKEAGEYELYASTMVVYFNEARSISDQSANLAAFWKNVKGPFDYIDLRYGSNIFYKAIK